MRVQHQILGNLRENKEDWYYLCNDAEQLLFKVKEQCKDDRAIKTLERMIIELNSIRMEQYNALNEYVLIEDKNTDVINNIIKAIEDNYVKEEKEYYKKYGMDESKAHPPYWTIEPNGENGIVVDISWGDWKHDHGYCSGLVKRTAEELGFDCVEDESEVYEEDGSDTYSAKHFYYFEPYELNEDVDIYSNVDEADMVNTLRNHFKGIKNKDYIDKSLRFHHKEGFINDDEYRQLKGEFLGNLTVKEYEDLPYMDFKASNTIGILNDGTPFLVTDDNIVYTIDEKISLNELKTMVYDEEESEEGYLNKYMEEHSKQLKDDELSTLILVDIGRLNDEVLDESIEDDAIEYSATIYQIKDIANCNYAFRDYDEAKDKINMDDYDAVASIVLPKKGSTSELLEQIFMLGNTNKDAFNVSGKFRSISVSDIIELDNEVYYVDSFGFKKIK